MIKYYRECFHYLGRGYKKYIPMVIIGAAVTGLLEIAGLLLLLPFIRLLVRPDSINHHPWMAELMRKFGMNTAFQQACFLGGLIILIFVVKNIYLMGYYYWQNRILRQWKIDVSSLLMRFYLFAPYKLHLTTTTERITRNVNHVVAHALNSFVFQGFLLVSNSIAGMIVLSLLLQRFFLFALLTAAALGITSFCQYYFLRRRLRALGREKNRLHIEQYKNIFQGLHSIKETKVLGREQFFLDGFQRINRATMDNDMWMLFYSQLPPHITEISAILCVVIMAVGVIHSTRSDNPAMIASLGVLAAIAFRTSTIANRIMKSLQQINHGQHAVEILLGELKNPLWQEFRQADLLPRDSASPQMPFQRHVRFENVSFMYDKAKQAALKQIDIQINKGEFIGIVGRSGAGKTTFVDLLLGLLQPMEGRILIDGRELAPNNVAGWQAHLGYVPQQVFILNDSAIRNVALGLPDDQIDRDRVSEALRKACLYDHLKGLSSGLETPLGENGRNLSGGEKQRIGIARALYRGADVLVLDEATASLDVPTEGEITRAVKALKGKQTIIAIAHRLSTLKSCDRILYFHEGALVGDGTFETLSQEHSNFETMIQLSRV